MTPKCNDTKFELETDQWLQGICSASGKPRFQNLSKSAKNASFGPVWVSRMFVNGDICIGNNLDGEETRWGMV